MYQEWVGQTVNRTFDYTCRIRGTAEALVSGAERLTYQDWQRRIFRLAHGLRTVGVRRGTRVACILDNSIEWAYLNLALYRLGAVVMPFNLTWVGREFAQALKMTDADVLVTLDSFRGKRYVDLLTETLPELSDAAPGEATVPSLPRLKTVITLSREGQRYGFAFDYWQVMESGADYSANDMLALAAEGSPEDECLCMLTSGSTGFPKPVMHTQRSFLANCSNYADTLEFGPEDRLLNLGTTYHISGLLLLFMPTLRGSVGVLLNWFEPEAALGLIERESTTAIWGFDLHYLMMRRHPRFSVYDISSLVKTMIGNDPRSHEEIKSMGIRHFGNIYGCSEYLSNFLPYRDRFDEHHSRLSNGRPMAEVQQKIVDPETGETLGVDQLGEICVKGPGLFAGYYGMPEQTAASIDADGYFHTGDYAYVDSAGYTYFRGRLKDMVKTGGENVSAAEVEIFLKTETPWIATALVFGIPDERWGEAVTALVELKPGASVSEKELREYCEGKLAAYKIPKRVLFVKGHDWIVTPTGKIDKQALRARTLASFGMEDPSP